MNRLISAIAAATALLLGTASANGQTDACATDVDGDGIVGGADLTVVLNDWGPCQQCLGDVNGDNAVDGIDLATVLTRWGGTCAPTVSGLTPDAGPIAGGVAVTITGNNLLNPLAVTFGGTPATVVGSSRSAISLVAPAGAQGSAPVLITTQGGTVSAGSFAYYGALTITAVTPNVGYAGGGQTVVVTGSGFYGAPSVRFGKSPASSVTILSPTQLSAVTPPGDVGTTASLTVSTPSGVTTLPAAFTYVAFTVPSWATLIEATPDPAVVWDPSLRNAIMRTGFAWRVRDTATGVEMVLIPAGSFQMGCSGSNTTGCSGSELPVHQVTLTNAFYLGRYEVTQAQWTATMGSNPSFYREASAEVPAAQVPNRPVEQVSWNTIQSFLTATGMRLPTEAEWEYSYRAGTTTAFHGFADQPNGTNDEARAVDLAWYCSNDCTQTRPVGGRAGNGFGLHDMSGNVWEWVNDWWSSNYYASSPLADPLGPASGSSRVLRGGGWIYNAFLRSSARGSDPPNVAHQFGGFRVARNP